MRKEEFSDQSPGRLVPIELGRHQTTSSGLIEIETTHALSFLPDPLPPSLDWTMIRGELFEVLNAATASLSRVNGLVPLAPNTGILRQALWLREARLSSQIENIHTTALDMVLAGERKNDAQSTAGREAWNAMKAVQYAQESPLPFSCQLIREMHRVLVTGTRGEHKCPGEFRDMPAYIGPENQPQQARFVPPPPGSLPGHVEDCMRSLEKWVNEEWTEIPALIRVAMMHYQFETIHPFRDGNGRIGRALILHQMCSRGLLDLPVVSISGYFQRYKQEYVDRLFAVSGDGDWVGWFRFFAEAMATQGAQTRVLCERLIAIHRTQTESIRSRGLPVRLLQLIDNLFQYPVVTARSVAKLLDVSDPTGRKDIAHLEEMDVLRLTGDVNYGKVWYAPAVLAVVEATDEEIEREFMS
jgi:cell filamentation protein, protein adenylyltransferase